jgi:hypothetical protein
MLCVQRVLLQVRCPLGPRVPVSASAPAPQATPAMEPHAVSTFLEHAANAAVLEGHKQVCRIACLVASSLLSECLLQG